MAKEQLKKRLNIPVIDVIEEGVAASCRNDFKENNDCQSRLKM